MITRSKSKNYQKLNFHRKMSNIFGFSEDMLPRHFPKVHRAKALQPVDETVIVTPQPTLPSVSLICTSENSIKPQHPIRKWNDRQCHAILQNDSMKHQAKSVKKHVRFVANNGDINRYISTERRDADVRSKLECSFFESQQKHRLYQPRRIKSEVADNIRQTPYEMSFLATEATRENCLSRSRFLPSDCHHQLHGNGPSKITDLQAENVVYGPREMVSEQSSQSHSSYEILLNILEEQQHHIAMQRNQILMQEKQNLEQQKEICILEYQIQQLLLQKEAVVIQTYEPTSSANIYKTKSVFPQEPPMDFGCKLSGFSNDTNNDQSVKNFGVSQVTNVAVSSFVFDTYGAANSAIFYNNINETVSASPLSSTSPATTPSCNSYGQSQLALDRSLVLNMLRMKYKCSEVEKSLDANQRQSDNHQFSDDIPFDVYDYLVRHGLIARQA
ncbi:uncharacterized protein LOC119080076 [Bradysia coprophila]|uniref:uncharacterized protein LOC119080076 n=1 Tax=Bradysia coprophila TaxID=38358 RepID=UPI00187DD594|nr:uncharacterized protein LOC119080076 [Bradysia coprophila]